MIDLAATYIHNKKEVKPTGRTATKERVGRIRRGVAPVTPTIETLYEMIPADSTVMEAKSFAIWVSEDELFKVTSIEKSHDS